MDGPPIDGGDSLAARELSSSVFEGATDGTGDFAGEVHIESAFTNAPGDEVRRVGDLEREEAVNGEACGFGGDEGGGAAVGEDEE